MGQLHIQRRDACSALGRDPKDTLAFLEAVLPVLPVLHVLPVLWVVSVLVLGSCARPEGIALDRPADGRIDDLERAALVEAARAGLRPAQDDPILLGLWNDFRVARYSQPDPAECAADHPFDWETEEAIRRDELEELRASCTLAGR